MLDLEQFLQDCSSVFDGSLIEEEWGIEAWERKARGNIEYIRNTDPADLAKMMFRWNLKPKQREIYTYVIENFVRLKKDDVLQVQIIGAYGVGKTTLEAMLILTILYLYDLMRDVSNPTGFQARLLSGTQQQVQTVMWKEIALILMNSHPHIKSKFQQHSKTLKYLPAMPLTVLDQFVWGTSTKTETKTGAHGGLVALFFDEGTAINDEAFKAAENYSSGRGEDGQNCVWIVTGNANKLNCEFHKNAISNLDYWKIFTWTRFCDLKEGEEDPYANRIRAKYGEDSDEWRVGVMAEFPLMEENVLIPRYMLNLAAERPQKEADIVYFGIDVAKGVNAGDYSVICVRNNYAVLEWWKGKVSIEVLKQKFTELYYFYMPRGIFPDEVGVGCGFADWLKLHFNNQQSEVIAINAGSKPEYNTAAADRRSEVGFLAAEWIRDIGHVPYEETFYEECTWIKWHVTERSKLKLISKNEMKRSTDMFDAFSYTFARKYSDSGAKMSGNRQFIGMKQQPFNARNSF
jgi:hypothetical protein